MFTKIILDYKKNLFQKLSEITDFENIIKGREGAVLVDVKNDLIPLVRTTTKYLKPAQKFKSIHYDIVEQIKEKANISDIKFNNALIEIYDSSYCKMGFHSDQALDLADNSYIAIYSCYENYQDINQSRKLIIKNKKTEESSEIIMEHNSVILFPLSTNQHHLHKIILENNNDNRWLGITFRLAKTFIHHINEIPFFYQTDNVLTLANKEESGNFYKLRGKENKSLEFKYPKFNYTVSISDTLLSS